MLLLASNIFIYLFFFFIKKVDRNKFLEVDEFWKILEKARDITLCHEYHDKENNSQRKDGNIKKISDSSPKKVPSTGLLQSEVKKKRILLLAQSSFLNSFCEFHPVLFQKFVH
jgi:hypothetical protein